MDNKRWSYGDTNRVAAEVKCSTEIEINNLLWLDRMGTVRPAGDMKPASGESWADITERFCRRFLGVAMERSRAGETDPIGVARTGVFAMDVRYDRRDFERGDLVGPSIDLGGRLYNQQIARVEKEAWAIGRVAKCAQHPVATVLVEIRSALMSGGVVQHELPGVKRLKLDPGDVLVWETDCCLSSKHMEQMVKSLQAIAPHNRIAVLPAGHLAVVDPSRLEPHKFNEL